MNYEKKIREYLNSSEVDQVYKRMLLNLFPELKESKDKRIRKILINIVKGACDKYGIKYQAKEIGEEELLAWLEKQGEHKKFRDSIQVGDKVTRNEEGVLVNLSQLNRVAKKQCEQKPAEWSEEDKSKIKGIINTLEGLYDNAASDTTKDLYRAKIDWLKSLRPQNRWKPSKEQIKAVEESIEFLGCTKKVREDLKSLYEQLKKL